MGSHANYYLIIEHLVTLKREFHRITHERYQSLIKELKNYDVYPHSDNEHLPDHKQLAVKLQYSQSKMNSILRDLLKELIHEFHYPPIKIKNHLHQFLIYIPWDEKEDFKNKDYWEQVRQQSVSLQMILPITPRIGEEIEIPFIQETGKFYRGYVHEVTHRINGNIQEIQIVVHPWDDFYHRWVKMQEEYERRKRWLASSLNQ
jgi:hypothetical protein